MGTPLAGGPADHDIVVSAVTRGWTAICSCGARSGVYRAAGIAHGWAGAHEETVGRDPGGEPADGTSGRT